MTLQQMKQMQPGDVFVDSSVHAKYPVIGQVVKLDRQGIIARGYDGKSEGWFLDDTGKSEMLLLFNERTASLLQLVDADRLSEGGYLV